MCAAVEKNRDLYSRKLLVGVGWIKCLSEGCLYIVQ